MQHIALRGDAAGQFHARRVERSVRVPHLAGAATADRHHLPLVPGHRADAPGVGVGEEQEPLGQAQPAGLGQRGL